MAARANGIETSSCFARALEAWTEENIVRKNEWIAQKAIEFWPI